MYIYNPSSENNYTQLFFIDDQFDEYMTLVEQSSLHLNEKEKIISTLIGSGKGTTVTELPIEGEGTYLNGYYDLTGYDSVHMVYEYDIDSLQLQGYKEIAYSDEQSQVISEVVFTYSDETLTTPEYVLDLQNPTETYSVTLYREDGETIEEYIVSKEAAFDLKVPEGCTLYTESTDIQSTQDARKDMKLYLGNSQY